MVACKAHAQGSGRGGPLWRCHGGQVWRARTPRPSGVRLTAMPPLLAAEPDAAPACSWAAVPGVSTRHALPAGLDTRTCGTFIAVATSRLEAWYTGSGAHPNDCGASHADAAVPADLCVYYFEVEVVDPGVRGTIGLGFSADAFNMSRQPGCVACAAGHTDEAGVTSSAVVNTGT